jgi:aspartate kinase
MTCIVQKYGGSSVAELDRLERIAERIAGVRRQGTDVAVVVSAMGKTTDRLVDMARKLTPSPPRREMDMLLSTGERITMALLSMALQEKGLDAVSLTGSQAGIITNDRHNDAQVIEVRPFRVQDEMAAGKVVIVGGFQGVSYKRDITTLGRGGSDTTAVALAAALNADRCEIYSDVDGVYSADPAVVADARHLPEMSYPVMQEMSAAGAKVLNAHAVQFAKEKQIAVYARASFASGRETVVRLMPPEVITGVQAVVSEERIVRVRFSGTDVLEDFDRAVRMLEERQVQIKEVNVCHVAADAGRSRAGFVVSTGNVYGWETLESELAGLFGDVIAFDHDLAALSLIGEGLNRNNLALTATMNLLRESGIPVAGVTTTSFRISLLVPRERIEDGVGICHRRWIEGHAPLPEDHPAGGGELER